MHPTVADLPSRLTLESFDEVYENEEAFESVYETIVDRILDLGQRPGGVTYAVPGHPFVAEATCPEIVRRAEDLGIPVRMIDGLSFLEPTFRILGLDPFPDLVLADAISISMSHTPGFPPSSPVLIAQIYSKAVASDVKLTLMSVYPDEHPVQLVHGAGTAEARLEDLPLYELDHSPHLGLMSSLFVPPLAPTASFESFQEVVARLRAPDGCPWDREQTHYSLRPFLLEETYETLDALDREDMIDLEEELGDLLLQIVLHAQIATEDGDFNIHHVLDGIGSKLIRRHPHVFSEVDVDGVSGVIRNWEAIKAAEREDTGSAEKKGLLDGVPAALPALSQAQAVVERVSRVGVSQLAGAGELSALRKSMEAYLQAENEEQQALLGRLLLALSSHAWQKDLDAESALREAISRFRGRFRRMEALAAEGEIALVDLSAEEKDQLWEQAATDEMEGQND
jgi:tetrapyrrole methylase family protein/MazG family protein